MRYGLLTAENVFSTSEQLDGLSLHEAFRRSFTAVMHSGGDRPSHDKAGGLAG